jgi:DNA-binding transcriptional regulator YhcF (GntR family)
VEPPYLRIARDLRNRITDGRLAPGARVPSTRQLARRWNVALATATKALGELQREGLVESRPRAGTVVAARAVEAPVGPRPARVDGELTTARVVRAAIEIADSEGLDALSMRGVAARVGASTMSTYRHVANKDELVLLMADAAYGELGYPPPHPTGWRERMERAGRTLWALHRRHPWLAHITPLTRPLPLPNLLVHSEHFLTALDEFGLAATERMDLEIVLFGHVQGVAMHLEREAQAAAATGVTEEGWMRVHGPAMGAIAASGRYPGFSALMSAFGGDGYDLDLDSIFELGMRLLLDGLAARLTPGRA